MRERGREGAPSAPDAQGKEVSILYKQSLGLEDQPGQRVGEAAAWAGGRRLRDDDRPLPRGCESSSLNPEAPNREAAKP